MKTLFIITAVLFALPALFGLGLQIKPAPFFDEALDQDGNLGMWTEAILATDP